MNPTLTTLLTLLAEATPDRLAAFNLRPDYNHPLSRAVFAWRDAGCPGLPTNDGLTNCSRCANFSPTPRMGGGICEILATPYTCLAKDGATGCPGFKARQ
jgi:hypothetical protein